MGKRSYRGRPKKSQSIDTGSLMGQFQNMQKKMEEQQEMLANEYVTTSAGGGAISIEISGHQRVRSIELSEELLDPAEREMLQDLLVAAVNAAVEESQAMAAARMEGLTGGLNPGDLLSGLGGG